MAQKGYVYPTNPPPYQAPGPAVYNYPPQSGGTTVVVQQQQPHVVTKSSNGIFGSLGGIGKDFGRDLDKLGNKIGKCADWTAKQIDDAVKVGTTSANQNVLRGLFGQLGHELNLLGKTITREMDWTVDQINKSLANTATGNILSLFQSGNVIQLVSRCSGRSLQILQGPASLLVDGLGPDGAPHATWTVVNEGNNQVRLHNNNNFLAIINGSTVLINMPPGVMHGVETKFRLTQRGQFIILESMKEPGKHVGILPNGQLKAALATGKEDHSMFGVRLIHSPYGVNAAAHK